MNESEYYADELSDDTLEKMVETLLFIEKYEKQ